MTTVLESLNRALLEVLAQDQDVVLLGEDILDPYGGAFKVTKGCSSAFPGRVFTTPISEAAMAGIANGLALAGKKPVIEIMFGDFVTLVADQVINHAAKFRWMYNGTVTVPLVIRTPMGGRRGYGPTHSQSLEKHFLGAPGLKVIAPNNLTDAGTLLRHCVLNETEPVLFVEHKLLYTSSQLKTGSKELIDLVVDLGQGPYPTATTRFAGVGRHHASILTYGYNFELARQAALDLAYQHEIFCEIVVFSQLTPFDLTPAFESAKRTGVVLTVEEGNQTLGWGSEVVAQVSTMLPGTKVGRVAALDVPIGNSKALEDEILPSLIRIKQSILGITQ